MASIYELSWNRDSFPAKLALFFKSNIREREKIRSGNPRMQADGYSALSSTYYSIAGTAAAKLSAVFRPLWLIWLAPVRAILWGFTWLPLGAWCYMRMLRLSEKVVETIGLDAMTADQCDIRQSILRKSGMLEEAHDCIRAALIKEPISAHTRGLLHVGFAEIYLAYKYHDAVRAYVRLALKDAWQAEQYDPRQAARIYRHCACLADRVDPIGTPAVLRRKAEELLRATGARDQMGKLG